MTNVEKYRKLIEFLLASEIKYDTRDDEDGFTVVIKDDIKENGEIGGYTETQFSFPYDDGAVEHYVNFSLTVAPT